jgi:C1A family cysteine protease
LKRGRGVKVFVLVSATVLVSFLTGSFSFAAHLDDIRSLIAAKGHKWKAGETSVWKLSDEQKRLRVGLLKREPTGLDQILTIQAAPLAVTPAGFDWRSNGGNYVSRVKDQGNCGSCWAFATTGALESYALIKDNMPGLNDDRAEEILLSCSTAGTCNGGYINTASDYIRGTGLPPEPSFPYTAAGSDDLCANAGTGWQTSTYKIASWAYATTTSPSVGAIKEALITYGPLVTTMDVYYDFYSYSGGVYEYAAGAYQGGHAILIVGYTDDTTVSGGGYFVVKNSWGTGWGESGYFNIAYSQVNSPVYFGEYTIAYKRPATQPAAPTNLGAASSSSSQINLIWTDNAGNEDGFKVERCTGAGCTGFSQVATLGANVTTYADKGLAGSATYTYRVRAYNSGGNSGYSNTAAAATPAAPVPPAVPTSLAAKVVSRTRIDLAWTDSSGNEDGFKVERCAGSNCTKFSQIAAIGANSTVYPDTTVRRGTSYSYRVRAYNAGGNSGYSNTVSAKTPR